MTEMKSVTGGIAGAGLLVLISACSSAAPTPVNRSSGMCEFATDAGFIYTCNTLTNLTSSGIAMNCVAPGQFTANQTCPTSGSVGTCTITLPNNGSSIVAYFYAPQTCDAAKASCNAANVSSGSTVSFVGNGC